jgi:hypothetical protein
MPRYSLDHSATTLNRLTSSSVTASGDPVAKFFSYDSLGNLKWTPWVGPLGSVS